MCKISTLTYSGNQILSSQVDSYIGMNFQIAGKCLGSDKDLVYKHQLVNKRIQIISKTIFSNIICLSSDIIHHSLRIGYS